jgi:hypothetical protein
MGKYAALQGERRSRGMTSRLGLLALVALGLRLVSHDLLSGLLAWVLVSFPIGVLAGHCVLNEQGGGGRPPE